VVGFDDHLPMPPPGPRGDDPTPRDDVAPEGDGPLKHIPQFDLRKPTIHHALEEVGTQLQVPIPPERPLGPGQNSPPRAI